MELVVVELAAVIEGVVENMVEDMDGDKSAHGEVHKKWDVQYIEYQGGK